MKKLTLIALLMSLFSFAGFSQSKPELKTVQDVDINRYQGTWYEISKLPNRFEKDLVAVKATYTLSKNKKKITVYNQGIKHTMQGKKQNIKGFAKVAGLGKLKVYFFWPFGGDYWILDLDPNYQYALVGSPDRNYLWILCRTAQMDNNTYNKLLSKAKAMGFDTDKVTMTTQQAD